jgi:energy-coupling factor transport system permease protein
LKDLPVDPFGLTYLRDRNSIFHKMDPLDKMILLGCVVILAIFSIPNNVHLVILLGLVTVAQVLCQPSLGEFLRPQKLLLAVFIPFLLLVTLTFSIQAPLIGLPKSDTSYLDILGVAIPYSQAGWRYGVSIFLRGMNVGMASLVLSWTTHPKDLVYTMVTKLKLNYRLAWSAFLALIYSPLIAYEAQMISYAQRVRQVKYNRYNLKDVFQKFLFPLMVRGSRKAVVTAMALDVRAFGAYPERTFRTHRTRSKYSMAFGMICLLLTIIYVIYNPPTLTGIFKPPGAI